MKSPTFRDDDQLRELLGEDIRESDDDCRDRCAKEAGCDKCLHVDFGRYEMLVYVKDFDPRTSYWAIEYVQSSSGGYPMGRLFGWYEIPHDRRRLIEQRVDFILDDVVRNMFEPDWEDVDRQDAMS